MPKTINSTASLRLSEKSATRQTIAIYGVHNEQCTLYIAYYKAEKHFSDSLVTHNGDIHHFIYQLFSLSAAYSIVNE
jgi:uncharacterized protein (DUF2141 family)